MNKVKIFKTLFIITAFTAFLAAAGFVHAALGDISTVAANNPKPDTWNTVAARVMNTNGVAIDSTGNIYIADAANHFVRRVATNGEMTIFAGKGLPGYTGDGLATSAKLYSPNDVAIDGAGNVYIADSQNHRVRKVGANGQITTVAGTGMAGYSGDGGAAIAARLNYPVDLAIDSAGNIFIADMGNNRIRKIDAAGIITTVAGSDAGARSGEGAGATSARLDYPMGVAADSSGNIYIADKFNNRVLKVDTKGAMTTIAGNGATAFAGDGGPATSASLFNPTGVEVDSAGNIFIADTFNNRIRKVGTDGVITTIAGDGKGRYFGDGGPASTASLYTPYRMAIDTVGNLYIADFSNNRIRKVESAGGAGHLVVAKASGNAVDKEQSAEAVIERETSAQANVSNSEAQSAEAATTPVVTEELAQTPAKSVEAAQDEEPVIAQAPAESAPPVAWDEEPVIAQTPTKSVVVAPVEEPVIAPVVEPLVVQTQVIKTPVAKEQVKEEQAAKEQVAKAPVVTAPIAKAPVVIAPPAVTAPEKAAVAAQAAAQPSKAQEKKAATTTPVSAGGIRKAQERANLNILKAGTGTGSVYSSPVGIICGADCSEAYPMGVLVDLMAAPDAGSSFAGWSGNADCNTGLRYIQLTMDADKTCTATFNVTHSLQLTQTGTGSGIITGEGNYKKGTVVTISAAPDSNSMFIGWSGDDDCKDGQVTMNADMFCSANFKIKTYTLKVENAGIGFGTITADGINCGTDCSEVFDSGTFVALTATSYAGSTFTGWSGSEGCSDGMVTMLESKTCVATFSAPLAKSTTLSSNRTSPQPVGTLITFSALGSGGSGYYEYEFWLKTGKKWTVTQGYSTINAWTWDTKGANPSTYSIRVYVRNIGSVAAYEAAQSISYKLTTPIASGITFYPSVASPQILGTPVTFTSAASGGSGSYEYQFWLKAAAADAAWELKQDYSSKATWAWDMTQLAPGTYTVMVYARNAGSTAQYQVSKSLSYTLSIPPVTGITLTPSLVGAWVVGTQVTFTSEASGGLGCYEYQFTLKSGTTTVIMQPYSKSDTWVWDTSKAAPGTYFISVAARSFGSTATHEVLMTKGYTISAQQVTGATLMPDISTQPEAGTPVTFTSEANGGSGSYEYQFWLKSGPSQTIVQGYSSANTWTWDTKDNAAGTYYVIVHVRNADSTAPYEVLVSKAYTIK